MLSDSQIKDLWEKGWDSYEAEPPSSIAIDNTRLALIVLGKLEFLPDRIVPSVEGGVSLVFSHDKKYVNIEFGNDGDVIVGISDESEEPKAWESGANEEELNQTVERLREFFKG